MEMHNCRRATTAGTALISGPEHPACLRRGMKAGRLVLRTAWPRWVPHSILYTLYCLTAAPWVPHSIPLRSLQQPLAVKRYKGSTGGVCPIHVPLRRAAP